VREGSVDSIEAGRYVEAGSFRTVDGAMTEQQRLGAQGIAVEVASSDGAEELYPDFQILLAVPYGSTTDSEKSLLKRLHANGVPSAFARELSPALEIEGPAAAAGTWIGELERTLCERPGLSGPLNVALSVEPDGNTASLDFQDDGCRTTLLAAEATDFTVGYEQQGACVGGGTWWLRPSGDELMVTLLPPDTDIIVLGTLHRSP